MTTLLTDDVRAEVERAFDGFIGNAPAVHTLRRSVLVARSHEPVKLDRVFLLVGAKSLGKTTLARKTATALGLPFLELDGVSAKTREQLFDAIEAMLVDSDDPNLLPKKVGDRGGMPIVKYPPCCIFVDEVHTLSNTTQNAMLKALEADDRCAVLSRAGVRRIADVSSVLFIFATTQQGLLDDAFRSRCTEVLLQPYSQSEVEAMIRAKVADLPDDVVPLVASASRLVPRRAFMLARDVLDEMLVSGKAGEVSFRSVAYGLGIVSRNGLTHDDMAYLRILAAEHGEPVGERVIIAGMQDIEPERVRDEIEPWLKRLGYVKATKGGRIITVTGVDVFKRLCESIEKLPLELARA